MNCQIVCCPGWNDGEELEKTMRALREMRPAVRSVAVVPVGLTKYREGLAHIEPFTPALAAETIDRVTAFGDVCVRETGERVFFCADELYLRAGRLLPPDAFYEDYPQLENGVGMLRLLETEFRLALSMSDSADGVPFSIACGVDAAPLMEKLLRAAGEKYGELRGRVYPVQNDFFGPGVTVTGLITGRDLIAQLKGRELGRRLLICRSMLRRDECDFLDSVTLDEASTALGVPIYPTEQDGGALCDAMLGFLPEIPQPKIDAEDTAYNKYKEF